MSIHIFDIPVLEKIDGSDVYLICVIDNPNRLVYLKSNEKKEKLNEKKSIKKAAEGGNSNVND